MAEGWQRATGAGFCRALLGPGGALERGPEGAGDGVGPTDMGTGSGRSADAGPAGRGAVAGVAAGCAGRGRGLTAELCLVVRLNE